MYSQKYEIASIYHENTKLDFISRKKINNEYILNLPKKEFFPINSFVSDYSDSRGNDFYELVSKRKSYNPMKLKIKPKIKFKTISNLLVYTYSSLEDKIDKIKTVPSAGSRYPIELYIVIFNVENLPEGLYYWDPLKKTLEFIRKGNFENEMIDSINIINKSDIYAASFCILFSANFEKTCSKYLDRGYRYVFLDAGYISQNFYLLSEKLGLTTRAIGGVYEDKIKKIINLNENEDIILAHIFTEEYILLSDQLKLGEENYFIK